MQYKLSFRQKLFLNFSLIFTIFTILVLIFQFEREKKYRTGNFETTLDNIAELTNNYITRYGIFSSGDFRLIDSLGAVLPGLSIRITLISKDGTVLYDSEVTDVESMENHLSRPEVQEAADAGTGANIRTSSTTGNSYYYFVRSYPDYFIRTAAIFNLKVQRSLHVERIFITYLVLLFIVFSLVLTLITRRISETITKLKDFAITLRSGKEPAQPIEFPTDELGVISSQIASIYGDLSRARQEISAEKEKLFSHLDALKEGVAFFTSSKERILANKHFIQNLNLITESSQSDLVTIFKIREMEPILQFIESQLKGEAPFPADTLPSKEIVIEKNSLVFHVKCMFFTDMSFEIVVTDATKLEKRKKIKQQMTSNIAHELRTPVTSILGYLETIQQSDIPEDTKKRFTERAYAQAERLSEMIGDLSALNRIEEGSETIVFEPVDIRKIVDEVLDHLHLKLEASKIGVHIDLPDKMVVNGNGELISSIFYNLFDNAIKYGGAGIQINLINYLVDARYNYFSFSNTGIPVKEKHLSRIFERFYRIDDARSRKMGGTGLGLSIVKNAVELHQGEIRARAYKDGEGLEFLFSLKK